MIYQTEKTLKENAAKATDAEKKAIEDAIKEAKEKLTSDNAEEMNQAAEKLAQSAHSLAQKIYEEAQKNQQAGGSEAGNAGKNDDVVDADYEVMDDDKKDDK